MKRTSGALLVLTCTLCAVVCAFATDIKVTPSHVEVGESHSRMLLQSRFGTHKVGAMVQKKITDENNEKAEETFLEDLDSGKMQVSMVEFKDIDPEDMACKKDIQAFCLDLLDHKAGGSRHLLQENLPGPKNSMGSRAYGSQLKGETKAIQEKIQGYKFGEDHSFQTGPKTKAGIGNAEVAKMLGYGLNKDSMLALRKASLASKHKVPKLLKTKFEDNPTVKNYFKMFNSTQTEKVEGADKVGDAKEFKAVRYSSPIAFCLKEAIAATLFDVRPDATKVSSQCKQTVRAFWRERAADIRNDPPLMHMCMKDIQSKCANTRIGKGRVLRCLKANKLTLNPRCAAIVTKRQIESAEDIELDAPLTISCRRDLRMLCGKVGDGQGAKHNCLKENANTLSDKCFTEVFRRQVEDAEDIRFDFKFAQACAGDVKEVCEGLPPGSGKAINCLFSAHRETKDKLSAECHDHISAQKRDRSDWRQHFRLRVLCYQDVVTHCKPELEAMNRTAPEESGDSHTRTVMNCLFEKKKELDSTTCQKEVENRLADTVNQEDKLHNDPCFMEWIKGCNGKKGAELKECMAQVQKSGKCEKHTEKQAQLTADKFSLRPGLARTCAAERKALCQEVIEGNNAVATCLYAHIDSAEMGQACKEALQADKKSASKSIWREPEIFTGCKADMAKHCADLPQHPTTGPDFGEMKRCLQEHRNELNSKVCQSKITSSLITHSDNWQMDAIFEKACKPDVSKYCAEAAKQGKKGGVHECLRTKVYFLAAECKSEVQRMQEISFEDVRLQPDIQEHCRGAIGTFCGKVEPGQGRVFDCLVEKTNKPGFPGSCASTIQEKLDLKSESVKYNPNIQKQCYKEIQDMCSDPTTQISCLADNYADVKWACRSAFLKYLKQLFQLYQFGHTVTMECDEHVTSMCDVTPKSIKLVDPGSILDCLQQKSDKLPDKCGNLVRSTMSDQLNPANKWSFMETPDQARTREDKLTKRMTASQEAFMREFKEELNSRPSEEEIKERVMKMMEERAAAQNNKDAEGLIISGPFAAVALVALGMVIAGGMIYYYKNQAKFNKGVVYVNKS